MTLHPALPQVLANLVAREDEPAIQSELAKLQPLSDTLGHRFAHPVLLRAALTLGSWANEHKTEGWPSNACLEFLGDAVLDLAIADEVWRRFPTAAEGQLTRLRAIVVSESALASMARKLDLGQWLFLGRGDTQRGASTHDGTLADAVEAIIASVYLDARVEKIDATEAAASFVCRLWDELLTPLTIEDTLDPKSRLQQVVQAQHRHTPVYVPVEEPVEDESARWTARIELRIPGQEIRILGESTGRSLKVAEVEAARVALEGETWKFDAD